VSNVEQYLAAIRTSAGRTRLGELIVGASRYREIPEHIAEILDALSPTSTRARSQRDAVREALIRRYARQIVRSERDGVAYESYEVPQAAAGYRGDLYEIVTLDFATDIWRQRARLYTEPGQVVSYSVPGDETEATAALLAEAGEALAQQREDGGADLALQQADLYAVALGSAAVHLRSVDGALRYDPVPGCHVSARYGETVETDRGVRAVDYGDLEDASAVIVRLAGGDGARQESAADEATDQYVAYCGRSEAYPRGRCVVYEARHEEQIPEPGAGGIEWCWSASGGRWEREPSRGELANPLTVAQELADDYSIPEYPVVRVLGDVAAAFGSDQFPLRDESFFEQTRELDVLASRLTRIATVTARGVFAITNPGGAPLPPVWDEGTVALTGEQTLQVLGQGGDGVRIGWEILRQLAEATSRTQGVPAYAVSVSQAQPESGVAIRLRAHGLERDRQRRLVANRKVWPRLFSIERALVRVHNGVEIFPEGARIQWAPGDLDQPVDPQIEATTLSALLSSGVVDRVEAVRRERGYRTPGEARAEVERMDERSPAPIAGGRAAALLARGVQRS